MNKDLIFKISKIVVICSLILLGCIALLFKNPKPIILGYIFGVSINILSFHLMNVSINKSVTMEPTRAMKYSYFNYLIRISMYFFVLFISAVANYLNIFAAFLGLTMVKNIICFLSIFDKDFLK